MINLGHLHRLGRATLSLTALLAFGQLSEALAKTVRIVQATSLELRRLDGQELVIITGEQDKPVQLQVDNDEVTADRVEYNRTQRTLSLFGKARYHNATEGQYLEGENLVIDLATDKLSGEDVIVSSSDLEIHGSAIERVPGQLRATNGYVTPCGQCGQEVNDYAVRAEQLLIYPGDRLVAYKAQFLLLDTPVLYFPVMVVPLNDPERQPRLVYGTDPINGRTVEADLPFSIGNHTLGTSILRYYEKRNPATGFGVAMRSYAPLPWVDRVNLYLLALPRPVSISKTDPGRDLDLNLAVTGRIPLDNAVRDLDYTLNVNHREIGKLLSDTSRDMTDIDFKAKVEYRSFSAEVLYLNRLGKEPTTALYTPLRHPEVTLDPKPYSAGALSVDTKFIVGQYTGGVNPASRKTQALVDNKPNITSTRLQEEHHISYTAKPFEDTEFGLKNDFVGRYYGTGARTVQLDVSATLSKRFNASNTFTTSYSYKRYEGTSPFSFDAIARQFSAPLTFSLSTVPEKDVTFNVTHTRDFFRKWNRQEPTKFSLNVSRKPLSLSSSLNVDFLEKKVESSSISITLSDPSVGSGTVTDPADPKKGLLVPSRAVWPAPSMTLSANGSYTASGGLQPFTVKATIIGDTRASSFSVWATHNMKTPELQSVGVQFNGVGNQDMIINPLSFSGSETLYLLDKSERMTGNYTVNWRNYSFGTTHDLMLRQDPAVKNSGTMYFSVGSQDGAARNWKVTYGGRYDIPRSGFTTPQLTASFKASEPGKQISASATFNVKGLDQKRTELVNASLNADAQFGTRLALSGNAQYYRSRDAKDVPTDILKFSPLRLGVAIGNEARPGAYFTAALQQEFKWVDGKAIGPQAPTPVFGLTIDRCCWALQAEIDMSLQRFRLGVSLPGSTNYPLFEHTKDGLEFPLLPNDKGKP